MSFAVNYTLPSGETLEVREALPEDAAALLAYVKTVLDESPNLSSGSDEFTLSEEEESEYLKGCMEADNCLYIIGLVDGEITAGLSFSGFLKSRLRHSGEFGMSVKKEYWGQGIGGKMVDALIAWAKDSPVTKINLTVRVDNERGVRLYKSKGFMIEGEVSRGMSVDGEYISLYHMGLEL